MVTMTPEIANTIYDILVEECGASDDDWRENFVHTETREPHPTFGVCTEYRFMGALGFGGKFWRTDRHDPVTKEWVRDCWWVDCYPEEKNPDKEQMIERANARLSALRADWTH